MANVWEMSTPLKPHWGMAPLPLPTKEESLGQMPFMHQNRKIKALKNSNTLTGNVDSKHL